MLCIQDLGSFCSNVIGTYSLATNSPHLQILSGKQEDLSKLVELGSQSESGNLSSSCEEESDGASRIFSGCDFKQGYPFLFLV